MRWAALLLSFLLAGCPSIPDAPTLPPDGGKASPVDAYADGADKVMDLAAAAVTVARTANAAGQPAVVDAELGVAQNALPRATPAELGKAQARAKAADPKAYQAAVAQADSLQRKLDDLWASVAQEKAKAKAALEAKQQELEAARAEQRDLLWTGAGLLLILAGVASVAWGGALGVSKAEAGVITLLGFAVGSLPWLLESDLSAWVLAPAGALVALRAVLWVWQLGRKRSLPKPTAETLNQKSINPPDA